MKSTINQRVNIFIEYKGLSQKSLSELLGLKRQNITNWINKGTAIKNEHLTEIVKTFPELNAHWLLTGEGEMLLEKNPVNYPEDDEIKNADDAKSPYHTKCTNPKCIEAISNLQGQVEAYKSMADKLSSRKDDPPEKHASGGLDTGKRAC